MIWQILPRASKCTTSYNTPQIKPEPPSVEASEATGIVAVPLEFLQHPNRRPGICQPCSCSVDAYVNLHVCPQYVHEGGRGRPWGLILSCTRSKPLRPGPVEE